MAVHMNYSVPFGFNKFARVAHELRNILLDYLFTTKDTKGYKSVSAKEMPTVKYVGRAQSIHSISRVPLSSNLQQPELSPNLPFGVFMEASLASIKSAR